MHTEQFLPVLTAPHAAGPDGALYSLVSDLLREQLADMARAMAQEGQRRLYSHIPHVTLSRKPGDPNPTAFDFIADIEPNQKSSEALDDIGVIRQPRIDRMQAHLLD